MGTLQAKLISSNGGSLVIKKMLITNEINRLPRLFALVQSSSPEVEPTLNTAYTLDLVDDAAHVYGMLARHWYVTEYRTLYFDASAQEQRFIVHCGVVPNQSNPLGSFALQSLDASQALSLYELLGQLPLPSNLQIDASGVASVRDPQGFELFCALDKTLEEVLRTVAANSETWFTVDASQATQCVAKWSAPMSLEGAGARVSGPGLQPTLIAKRTIGGASHVNTFWGASREEPGESPIGISDTAITFMQALPERAGQFKRYRQTQFCDAMSAGDGTFQVSYLADQNLAALRYGAGDVVASGSGEHTLLSMVHLFDFENGMDRLMRNIDAHWGGAAEMTLLTRAIPPGAAYGFLAMAAPNGYLPNNSLLGTVLLEQEAPEALWQSLAQSLGLPLRRAHFGRSAPRAALPPVQLGVVAPRDTDSESSLQSALADAHIAGQYAAMVNVQFDWLAHPVRVPLAASLSGRSGDVFFQPSPGDLVLVSFIDGDASPVIVSALHYRDHPVSASLAEADMAIGKAWGKQTEVRGISVADGLIIESRGDGSDVVIRAKNRLILAAGNHVVMLNGCDVHGL